jgi:hypothetical protein
MTGVQGQGNLRSQFSRSLRRMGPCLRRDDENVVAMLS